MGRKAAEKRVDKYRQEKEKNTARIAQLQDRNQELERLILEAENTEIIAMVRSVRLGPEQLAALIRGLRAGEAPVLHEGQIQDEQEDEGYEG